MTVSLGAPVWGAGAKVWWKESSTRRSGRWEELRQRMLTQRAELLSFDLASRPSIALDDSVWMGIQAKIDAYSDTISRWHLRFEGFGDLWRRFLYPLPKEEIFVAATHQRGQGELLRYFRGLARIQQSRSKGGYRMVSPTLNWIDRVLKASCGRSGTFVDFGSGPGGTAKRILAELDGHQSKIGIVCLDHSRLLIRLGQNEVVPKEIGAGLVRMVCADVTNPEEYISTLRTQLKDLGSNGALAAMSSLFLHELPLSCYPRVLLISDAISQFGGYHKDVKDSPMNLIRMVLIPLNLTSGGSWQLVQGMWRSYGLALPDGVIGPLIEIVGGKIRNATFFRECYSRKAAELLGIS